MYVDDFEQEEQKSTYTEGELELKFSKLEWKNAESNEWKIRDKVTHEWKCREKKSKWISEDRHFGRLSNPETEVNQSHHEASKSCALCGDRPTILNCHGDILDAPEAMTLSQSHQKDIAWNNCSSGNSADEPVLEINHADIDLVNTVTSPSENHEQTIKQLPPEPERKSIYASRSKGYQKIFRENFVINKFPNTEEKEIAAKKLKVPAGKTVNLFNNNRSADKTKHKTQINHNSTNKKTSKSDSRHIETFEDQSPDLHNVSSIKEGIPGHVQEEDGISKNNCSEHKLKSSIIIHTQQETDYQQTLQEYFLANRYPDNKEKNRLAEELGISVQKIAKWFVNKRYHSVQQAKKQRKPPTKYDIYQKILKEYFATNQYPNTDQKEKLAKELNVTVVKIENWFNYKRRSDRNKHYTQ